MQNKFEIFILIWCHAFALHFSQAINILQAAEPASVRKTDLIQFYGVNKISLREMMMICPKHETHAQEEEGVPYGLFYYLSLPTVCRVLSAEFQPQPRPPPPPPSCGLAAANKVHPLLLLSRVAQIMIILLHSACHGVIKCRLHSASTSSFSPPPPPLSLRTHRMRTCRFVVCPIYLLDCL